MKVTGSSNAGRAAGVGASRPQPGGATFTPITTPSASGPARVTASAGVAGVSSLEALIALQEVGTPLERRRKAAARGGRMLDALESLKVGLLEGVLPQPAIESLAREAREQRGLTDDPGLDAILAEIETRASVELAKLEIARATA